MGTTKGNLTRELRQLKIALNGETDPKIRAEIERDIFRIEDELTDPNRDLSQAGNLGNLKQAEEMANLHKLAKERMKREAAIESMKLVGGSYGKIASLAMEKKEEKIRQAELKERLKTSQATRAASGGGVNKGFAKLSQANNDRERREWEEKINAARAANNTQIRNSQNTNDAPKWGKTKSALKFAGGVAAGGVAAAAWAKSKGERLKSNFDESDEGRVDLLYFLAISVHLIDWWVFHFAISPTSVIYRLLLYFLIGWYAHYVMESPSFWASIRNFGFVSLFPIFIIPSAHRIALWIGAAPTWADFLAGFVFAIPIWIIFLNNKIKLPREKTSALSNFFSSLVHPRKLAHLYMAVLFFLLMVNVILVLGENVAELDEIQYAGINPQVALYSFVGWSGDRVMDVWNGFRGLFTEIRGTLDKKISGLYYYGKVEDGKEEVGATIASFKTLGGRQKFTQGEQVVFTGEIAINQLERATNTTYFCEVEKISDIPTIQPDGTLKRPVYSGTATSIRSGTDKSFFTKFEQTDVVNCIFDSLEEGTYQGALRVEFDFESWGYVTYYFMNREFIATEDFNNVNINQKYNIPAQAVAESTDGPTKIMMGLETVRLPIPLTFEETSPIKNSFIVGLSLVDKYALQSLSGGNIKKVKAVEIRVPKEVKLNCQNIETPTPKPDTELQTYQIYRFDEPDYPKDVPSFNIYCNAEISPADAKNLIKEEDAQLEMFIAGMGSYDYQLIKKSPYRVHILNATG